MVILSMHVWSRLADLVLIVHVAVAVFVVFGQIAIVVGGVGGLTWVRNLRFRLAHLTVVTFIAVQTCIGAECPLTQFERAIRAQSGQSFYMETFTEHWISPLLFFPAPAWFFILLHSGAALIVLGSLILIPPQVGSAGARRSVEDR